MKTMYVHHPLPVCEMFHILFTLYFSVASDTGIVTLKPNVPEVTFTFAVDVLDKVGKNAGTSARSTVTVEVKYISEEAVYSSGSVRIDGI